MGGINSSCSERSLESPGLFTGGQWRTRADTIQPPGDAGLEGPKAQSGNSAQIIKKFFGPFFRVFPP
jgi:hypothetical protein